MRVYALRLFGAFITGVFVSLLIIMAAMRVFDNNLDLSAVVGLFLIVLVFFHVIAVQVSE